MLSLNMHHSEEIFLTQVQREYKYIVLFSLQLPHVHSGVNKESDNMACLFLLSPAQFVAMACYCRRKQISQASPNNPIIQ